MHEDAERDLGLGRFGPAAAAGLILVAALTLSWVRLDGQLQNLLSLAALLIAAVPTIMDAAKHVRANPFNTSVLMMVAAVGAGLIGFYSEAAAVLVLYNLAEALEDYTTDKARGLAKSVAKLLPQRALRKTENGLEEVDVEELRVGEIVVVKPGWRIPVDGRIVSGRSAVDQSIVTGESMPLERSPGDPVLSGTLCLNGSLELRVEKPFQESTARRIANLVVEAREQKASIQRFVDRLTRYYTPTAIAASALIAFVPPIVFGQPLSTWVYRALIVLVIACPSAIAIATPVTVLMALTRAMWSQVLVKGGKYLEEMSRVGVVAFDKTGTLTKGKLTVTAVKPAEGFTEKEVIHLSALAESRSAHPAAVAIMAAARSMGVEPREDVQMRELPGVGVAASSSTVPRIVVGRHAYVQSDATHPEHDEAAPERVVEVAVGGVFAGMIVFSDELRSEAGEAIAELRSMKLRVEMLTGDDEEVAKKIAGQLGIANYHAGLLPEDKVRIAIQLRQRYGAVMMVGDGVNDAAALAASNVGVAVGSAGNDLAIEAADVAMLGSDLRRVGYMLRLSRKAVSTLKLSIAGALGLKLLLLSLGVLGLIPLWVGVVGDDGVTLAIIGFAARLLRFK